MRPVLGQRAPFLIAHLAAVCPGPLLEITLDTWQSPLAHAPRVDPGRMACELEGARLEVRFEWRGRVEAIELSHFADDAEATALFDRAIAPLVAPDLRDRMRVSILGTPDIYRGDDYSAGSVAGTGGRVIVRRQSLRHLDEHHLVWELRFPAREAAPGDSERTRESPLGRLSAARLDAWTHTCSAPLRTTATTTADPSADLPTYERRAASPDRWHPLRRPPGSQIVECIEGHRRGGQAIGWRVEADRRGRIYRITALAESAETLPARAEVATALIPLALLREATAAITADPPFAPPIDTSTGRLALQVSRAAEPGWGAELMWWIVPSLLPDRE